MHTGNNTQNVTKPRSSPATPHCRSAPTCANALTHWHCKPKALSICKRSSPANHRRKPEASVTMTQGDQARLTGDVLVAERPRRLSYTLGDHPGQPSVYVNWELRALGDATIVRLYVDEPWPDADPTHDLEAAWLPVLYDLVAYLDWGAGRFPPDRDLPDPSELRFAGLPMPGRTAPATSPRRARACAAVRARSSSSSEATGEPPARRPAPARRERRAPRSCWQAESPRTCWPTPRPGP